MGQGSIVRNRSRRDWGAGFQGREVAAVAAHEVEEFAGLPVAGAVTLRFGEGAEEPAEVVPVGPHRDVDLVAAEEGDGGADAVDGGAVGEVAFEVEAETLLGSAADGEDDVLRTEAFEAFEQNRIGERRGTTFRWFRATGGGGIHGGQVDVVIGDGDSLPLQPGAIALCAAGAGHDPDGVAGPADAGFEEKDAQILQAGEAPDGRPLQTVPDENHEGGVGNGEIGIEEGVAVAGITLEVFESGGGRDDEKTAFAHEGNGGPGGPVEEVDAEDAVEVGGLRPTDRTCRPVGHADVIFRREVGHNTGISTRSIVMFA